MIQLEFAPIRRWFAATVAVCRRRPPPAKQNAIDYTLRLAGALRVFNMTHQVHDVLCAVAKLENERGFATIPQICYELSCTYQNVVQHLMKNPDWFLCDEQAKPRQYRLAPEAIRILAKVQKRIKQTATP